MKNQYRTLANQFIREHVEKSQWSSFDRVECRAMQMFAEWLDARAADEPPANPSALKCPTCKRPMEEVKISELREYFEPPADPAESLREIIEQIVAEGGADQNSDAYLGEEMLARIRTALNRQAEPGDDEVVPHGVIFDKIGWCCSICGGWNHERDRLCTHTHSVPNRTPDP